MIKINKVRKCDRCHAIFEQTTGAIIKEISWKGNRWKVDLCPDCQIELIKWIKNEEEYKSIEDIPSLPLPKIGRF